MNNLKIKNNILNVFHGHNLTVMLCMLVCLQALEAAAISVGNIPADKVLFLGNSLTHHSPMESIGWTGDWGMDASCRENDYAHLVAQEIADVNGGTEPAVTAVNIYNYGGFEQNYISYDAETELSDLVAWQPDIVVFEIGDNSAGSLTTEAAKTAFADGFADVVSVFKNSNQPEMFVVSTFWDNEVTNSILYQACEDAGGTYVDLGGLYANAANRGGWGGHPNDTGMAAIADRVWVSMALTGASVPEPTVVVLLLTGLLALPVRSTKKLLLGRSR